LGDEMLEEITLSALVIAVSSAEVSEESKVALNVMLALAVGTKAKSAENINP
jgi:hypothetical protein